MQLAMGILKVKRQRPQQTKIDDESIHQQGKHRATALQVIILLGQGLFHGRLQFLIILRNKLLIDLDLWRCQSRGSNELKVRVAK